MLLVEKILFAGLESGFFKQSKITHGYMWAGKKV